MLGILDHNLTTVVIPTLDQDAAGMSTRFNTNPPPLAPASGLLGQSVERKMIRDTFDAEIFGGTAREISARDFKPLPSRNSVGSGRNSQVFSTSYQSAREDLKEMPANSRAETTSILSSSLHPDNGPKRFRGGISFAADPAPINLGKPAHVPTPVQPVAVPSPRAPSPSLSLASSNRQKPRPLSSSLASATSTVVTDVATGSGASTPRLTPAKKVLRSQASKSSFAGKFGSGWLFGAFTGRSQPSFPTADVLTVERRDVSTSEAKSKAATSTTPAEITSNSPSLPRAVPGGPAGASSIPVPNMEPADKRSTKPISIRPRSVESKRRHRDEDDDAVANSSRTSVNRGTEPISDSSRHGKSWDDLSWKKKAGAALTRADKHTVVNPCHPSGNTIDTTGHGRRWQHSRPKAEGNNTHLVKWKSLTAPACLPLTTHFIPSAADLKEHFTENAYDIACFPGEISFLLKPEAAHDNLPLAVMREMASQRLSRTCYSSQR